MFGVETKYVFVLISETLTENAAAAVTKDAERIGATPVAIGDVFPEGFIGLSWQNFQARLGGPIKSLLPLEETFLYHITELGHDRPVEGLQGTPDDLFEEYVHAGLQFLLRERVIRYGQERRFEAVPDGVGLGDLLIMYDAKAYGKGYSVDEDSIRQFKSYVDDFHNRYESYMGRVHAFVVVSGFFKNKEETLHARSAEMYSKSSVPLVYLKAEELGKMVSLLSSNPVARGAVDWKAIFATQLITSKQVEAELARVAKDGIAGT